MQCPVCENSALQMSERQGVEIDYCPKCRGIWLDRGELDKIIDRAAQEGSRGQGAEPQHTQREQQHSEQKSHKKKKSSFLGDLFDF